MGNQQYRPGLLDVPISFFEYDHNNKAFSTIPGQVTTLRRMVTKTYYRSKIDAIRAEPDEEKQKRLKRSLPAITPVALLHHRKRDVPVTQKIRQQWPMMMGDIDTKDNPDVDMSQLKAKVSCLPYVLLCAYSVRGGLWFVVRLPDHQTPDTLAAHFRYLQKLFSERFGIPLDNTKGGNPTDLRFVSYDSDPYINDTATVMTGTYTEPQTARPLLTPIFSSDADKTRRDVEDCIGQINRRHIDIAPTYGEWFALGQSLASTFGESGRDYYHLCSQHSPTYNPVETDRKFSDCLKACQRVGVGTFFHFCKQSDIEPERKSYQRPMTVPTAKPYIGPLAVGTVNTSSDVLTNTVTSRPASSSPAPVAVAPSVGFVEAERPNFFEWQKQHPYFGQMGLASLARKNPAAAP